MIFHLAVVLLISIFARPYLVGYLPAITAFFEQLCPLCDPTNHVSLRFFLVFQSTHAYLFFLFKLSFAMAIYWFLVEKLLGLKLLGPYLQLDGDSLAFKVYRLSFRFYTIYYLINSCLICYTMFVYPDDWAFFEVLSNFHVICYFAQSYYAKIKMESMKKLLSDYYDILYPADTSDMKKRILEVLKNHHIVFNTQGSKKDMREALLNHITRKIISAKTTIGHTLLIAIIIYLVCFIVNIFILCCNYCDVWLPAFFKYPILNVFVFYQIFYYIVTLLMILLEFVIYFVYYHTDHKPDEIIEIFTYRLYSRIEKDELSERFASYLEIIDNDIEFTNFRDSCESAKDNLTVKNFNDS